MPDRRGTIARQATAHIRTSWSRRSEPPSGLAVLRPPASFAPARYSGRHLPGLLYLTATVSASRASPIRFAGPAWHPGAPSQPAWYAGPVPRPARRTTRAQVRAMTKDGDDDRHPTPRRRPQGRVPGMKRRRALDARRTGRRAPAIRERRTCPTISDEPMRRTGTTRPTPRPPGTGPAERQPSRRLQDRRTGTHRDAGGENSRSGPSAPPANGGRLDLPVERNENGPRARDSPPSTSPSARPRASSTAGWRRRTACARRCAAAVARLQTTRLRQRRRTP